MIDGIYLFNLFLILLLAVSLVDGYNLPMSVNNNAGCGVPLCGVDLGPNCQSSDKSLMTSRSTLLLTIWKVPHHSKGHSIQLDSLWDARVLAMQALRPTQTMTQIVAQEYTTLPQPVRPQAFSIILTSVSLF